MNQEVISSSHFPDSEFAVISRQTEFICLCRRSFPLSLPLNSPYLNPLRPFLSSLIHAFLTHRRRE
jgi:hypothetical protein